MHLAVEKGNLEIVKLLIKNKRIDINTKDGENRKPIDYATNDEIKQLLKNDSPLLGFFKNLFNK